MLVFVLCRGAFKQPGIFFSSRTPRKDASTCAEILRDSELPQSAAIASRPIMEFLMASISIPRTGRAMRLLALLLAAGTAAHLAAQSNDQVSPEVQRLYAEARAAQQHGDTAAAISNYRAMIKAAPHLAAAYNNLGMLYFNEH